MVRAKWACSLRFFLVKMSGFDRLLTKAASVMSQKMADLVLVLWQSLRESVLEVLSVALACTRPC